MSGELQLVEKLEELETIFKENKLVVAAFFTNWCPYHQFDPTFIKLSKEFPEAKFIKIDIEKSEDINEKYEIETFPTFSFFKEGNESSRLEGAKEKKLIKKIKELIGKKIEKEKGVLDTLKEYESLISSKKLVAVHFIPDDGGIEKLNLFFESLMAEEKFKQIEFLIVDDEDTKERNEIIEKAKAEVTENSECIFFKDGKEYSRIKRISKRLLIRNLENLAELPLSDNTDFIFTVEKYAELIKENSLVCSVFLSDFMGSCEHASNFADKLSKEEEWKNVKFIKVYYEESIELIHKESPRDIPRFIFYKDGKAEYDCSAEEEKIKYKLCKITGKPTPKIEGQINNLIELEEIIKSNKLVAVNFFAEWCEPSRAITPKFNELSKNGELSEIKFYKVDADDAKDITEKYEIKSLPTFFFFKNGEIIKKYNGADIKKIEKILFKLAEKPLPKVEGYLYNLKEYEESIKNNKLAVIAFFSESNEDYDYLVSEIDYFKNNYEKIKFFIVDREESKEICTKYGINTPLFIYYEDGKEFRRSEVGNTESIKDDIEDLLPNNGDPYNTKFHEHPLYPKEEKNFVCSCCNSPYWPKPSTSFYCRKCLYYLCEICKQHEEKNEPIDKKEIINSKYHAKHPLVPIKKSCFCNVCNNGFDHSYCCLKCNYDLCEECHKKE